MAISDEKATQLGHGVVSAALGELPAKRPCCARYLKTGGWCQERDFSDECPSAGYCAPSLCGTYDEYATGRYHREARACKSAPGARDRHLFLVITPSP